jgi:hypothetical protein
LPRWLFAAAWPIWIERAGNALFHRRRLLDGVAALFGRVDEGVDAYLDWYFSVVGEYQRLGAAVVDDLGGLMAGATNRYLLEAIGFEVRLQALWADVDADSGARLADAAAAASQRKRHAAFAGGSDCTVDGIDLAAALGGKLAAKKGVSTLVSGLGAAALCSPRHSRRNRPPASTPVSCSFSRASAVTSFRRATGCRWRVDAEPCDPLTPTGCAVPRR